MNRLQTVKATTARPRVPATVGAPLPARPRVVRVELGSCTVEIEPSGATADELGEVLTRVGFVPMID